MAILQLAIDARKARDGAGRFVKATDKVSKGAKKADRQLRGMQKQADKTGGSLRKLVGPIAAVVTSLGGILIARKAIGVIAGFEETMAVLKGVAGATNTELERLSKTARFFGATTRFSAKQAGEGLLFLARAGFTANQAIAALPATLNLATAGMLDLGEAADIASNTAAQFGIAADQTERIVDTLINTANSANTDVRQLAEAMKFAGSVAGKLNKSVEETAAALGVMGDAGIQASMAGTSLRMIMLSLLKPTKKNEAALKRLSLQFSDVDIKTKSLAEIFKTLRDANLGAEEALDIFGTRAVGAALQLASAADKVRDLTKANEEAEGVAKRIAELMEKTLSGAFLSLKSAVEEAFLSMGDKGLLKGMRGIVELTTNVVRSLSGMKESIKGSTVAVDLLTAGVIALTVAFSVLVIPKVIVLLIGFKTAVAAIGIAVSFAIAPVTVLTAGIIALGAAILANPLGAIIIAAGLAAVAFTVYTSKLVDAAKESNKFVGQADVLANSLLNLAKEGLKTEKFIIRIEKLGKRREVFLSLERSANKTKKEITSLLKVLELASRVEDIRIIFKGIEDQRKELEKFQKAMDELSVENVKKIIKKDLKPLGELGLLLDIEINVKAPDIPEIIDGFKKQFGELESLSKEIDFFDPRRVEEQAEIVKSAIDIIEKKALFTTKVIENLRKKLAELAKIPIEKQELFGPPVPPSALRLPTRIPEDLPIFDLTDAFKTELGKLRTLAGDIGIPDQKVIDKFNELQTSLGFIEEQGLLATDVIKRFNDELQRSLGLRIERPLKPSDVLRVPELGEEPVGPEGIPPTDFGALFEQFTMPKTGIEAFAEQFGVSMDSIRNKLLEGQEAFQNWTSELQTSAEAAMLIEDAKRQVFEQVGAAVIGTFIDQAIAGKLSARGIVAAAFEATSGVLKALAQEAAAKALFALAEGLLTNNPKKLAAAAIFGKIAGIAAVGAIATGVIARKLRTEEEEERRTFIDQRRAPARRREPQIIETSTEQQRQASVTQVFIDGNVIGNTKFADLIADSIMKRRGDGRSFG